MAFLTNIIVKASSVTVTTNRRMDSSKLTRRWLHSMLVKRAVSQAGLGASGGVGGCAGAGSICVALATIQNTDGRLNLKLRLLSTPNPPLTPPTTLPTHLKSLTNHTSSAVLCITAKFKSHRAVSSYTARGGCSPPTIYWL